MVAHCLATDERTGEHPTFKMPL